MHVIKISVRHLVEFIKRSGDIDRTVGAVSDAEAMQKGGQVHRKLQKAAGADYRAEVPLKIEVMVDADMTIVLEGRADGVITEYRIPDITESLKTDGGPDDSRGINYEAYTVDEIKSTYTPLSRIKDPLPVHLAQAKCYAYILAREKHLQTIDVQMTYVHIETGKVKRFTRTQTFEALEQWFLDLVEQYAVWMRWQIAWIRNRNESIAGLKFPFEYRKGQKRLISGVYQTLSQKKKLFALAPTGTGKTICALFPAIKALGEGKGERIFYLTARTITRTVAEETYHLLGQNHLAFKSLTLTARDKICIFDEPRCHPQDCERACGHFDRINAAVFDMITHENEMTRSVIRQYALRHKVCPFELQLDAAVWCDGIIGDYNYVFDPNAYLKRFFGDTYFGGGHAPYTFLIDEAHNLVDRAREMYSAKLLLSQLTALKAAVMPYGARLVQKTDKCIKYMEELRDDGGAWQTLESISGFIMYLGRMLTDMESFLKSTAPVETREKVRTVYLDIKRLINTGEAMDDRYVIYSERQDAGDFMIKIFCMDPSKDLGQRLDSGGRTVFFSATLLPVHYYKELLSTTPEKDYDLYVDSPFDPQKRLIVTATDVSSRYARRNLSEYHKISEYIKILVRARNGNYLVFFPSYAYMASVYEVFSEKELCKAGSGIRIVMQENAMTEDARQNFLAQFQADTASTVIGFCVLGGIFSEGIDLKEDRLIGAIVVGTGLPQIGTEREILRAYYDEKQGCGYAYAYVYPGMNKVLQAGGRVIRTENDKGMIALLDERFNTSAYKYLFPKEWLPYTKVHLKNVEEKVNDFWEYILESSESEKYV